MEAQKDHLNGNGVHHELNGHHQASQPIRSVNCGINVCRRTRHMVVVLSQHTLRDTQSSQMTL